jgi:hypothetical protein
LENKIAIVIEIIMELMRHGNDPNVKKIFDLVDEIEQEAIKRNYIADTRTEYVKIMESRK